MNIHPHEPTRVQLAELPTPLVELPNLAHHVGAERILLKRDDLAGLELSGNKVRKLEYVVADALAQGADTLVTHGGYQSNHCRATAAIGARLGLRVRMLLRSATANPAWDGNLLLDHLFGAEVSYHPPELYAARLAELVAETLETEREAGRRPYFFPVGASVPLGCWGYIRCVAELVEQLSRDTDVELFCATSSGGTQVGLMLGKALLGCRHWRILGVPVSDSVPYFQKHLQALLRETVEAFGLEVQLEQTRLELVDGFIGEGYAIPYPAAVETIRLLARTEGILLDPSYTAKAMTGMLAQIRSGGLRPDAVPVFLHTGGAFGLFARRDLIDPGSAA